MGIRLSKERRTRILQELAEHHAERELHQSERRRYLSQAHGLSAETVGIYAILLSLGLALYTHHSDYLVAGGGISIVAGVAAFGLMFRERIASEVERLSTIARSGEDDSEVSKRLLEQLFRNAEQKSFWLVVVGTLISSFAGLVWRWIGWS